jgi:ribosomal protein S16
MLKIRLVRIGKKNLPSFRIEVTEGEKTVDLIGSYYPHSAKSNFSISKNKFEHWLKSGAKPTSAVADLIKGKYEFKPYHGEVAAKEEKAPPAAPIAAAVEAQEPTPLETPIAEGSEEPVKS